MMNMTRQTIDTMVASLDEVTRLEVSDASRSGGKRSTMGSTRAASVRPHLEYLSGRVDETVHVMVVEGSVCRFVDSVECRRPLRVTGRVGVEYPAHTTSGGKALLAAMSDARLRELYPDERLPRHNERSLSTRAQLFRELEDVRVRGYALNRGESSEGIAAIAAALRLSRATTAVAIAISAPEQRMPDDRVDEFAAELVELQRRLRQTFG